MATRSTSAIALHPIGNERGGYYFMSLATGEHINRRIWTEFLMSNDIIARVKEMALEQGQPLLKRGGPLFEWIPGVMITNTPLTLDEPILMDAINDYARAPDPSNHVLNELASNGEQLYDDKGSPLPHQHYEVGDNVAGMGDIVVIDNDVKNYGWRRRHH